MSPCIEPAVIAACKTSLDVLHTPGVVELHPFVICVGREDEPYRIRRATFAYDPTYPGQALPLLSAEIRSVSGSVGLVLDRVIPDSLSLCPSGESLHDAGAFSSCELCRAEGFGDQ